MYDPMEPLAWSNKKYINILMGTIFAIGFNKLTPAKEFFFFYPETGIH